MSEQGLETRTKSYFNLSNIIVAFIIIAGVIATVLRFSKGLGAVTNLSDDSPWGLIVWFQLVTISLAGAGYVTICGVHIFGMKRYQSSIRPAVLLGLLGYCLFAISLIYDLGRPWRFAFPFYKSQGTASVLFEVSLCAALYMIVLCLELSPAVWERMGFRKLRDKTVKITILLTVFGVLLSTLHQSSLGALFLIAPSKIHPLWYSRFLPVYFLVTSIFGGLALVIFVDWLSRGFLKSQISETYLAEKDALVLGFGKAAALVMAGYFIIRIFGISTANTWGYLFSGWGVLYQVELVGFILLPCMMFAVGSREKNLTLIRWTSALTIVGIFLSKLNIAIVAFNYRLPVDNRYFPSAWEIILVLFLITIGVLAFKWAVTVLPIMREHKGYPFEHL